MNAVRDNGRTIDHHMGDAEGISSWFVKCGAIDHHSGIKHGYVGNRAAAKNTAILESQRGGWRASHLVDGVRQGQQTELTRASRAVRQSSRAA